MATKFDPSPVPHFAEAHVFADMGRHFICREDSMGPVVVLALLVNCLSLIYGSLRHTMLIL
jgi:hypothetical protein